MLKIEINTSDWQKKRGIPTIIPSGGYIEPYGMGLAPTEDSEPTGDNTITHETYAFRFFRNDDGYKDWLKIDRKTMVCTLELIEKIELLEYAGWGGVPYLPKRKGEIPPYLPFKEIPSEKVEQIDEEVDKWCFDGDKSKYIIYRRAPWVIEIGQNWDSPPQGEYWGICRGRFAYGLAGQWETKSSNSTQELTNNVNRGT